jgi:SAM-dependent methyltransferase
LDLVSNPFKNILDIGCRAGDLLRVLRLKYPDATITATDISSTILNRTRPEVAKLIELDEEEISRISNSKNNKFDLITYSLGLHWINDVQGFLSQILDLLAPEGIFIANFIGGESFRKLRLALASAEMEAKSGHFPHIPPFINFDHASLLLQQAGFKSVVTDFEDIELEYKTPIDLMREIQKSGESNILLSRSNFAINKKVFKSLSQQQETRFTDHVKLISIIASKEKNVISTQF